MNGISPGLEQFSLAFMNVVQVSSNKNRPPMSFLHTRAARENTVLPQSCSTAFSRKKKYVKFPMSYEDTKLGSGFKNEKKKQLQLVKEEFFG